MKKPIHSANQEYPRPSVIKLVHIVRPKSIGVRFNKANVFLRDKGHCVYCNKKLALRTSTIDHVIPKSRGGKTNFQNVVIACGKCNWQKSNKTPEEAGMTLTSYPKTPILFNAWTSIKYIKTSPYYNQKWDKWLPEE